MLSSEGLCSSHLALLRQLTSALFPTAPARLLQSFRFRFAYTPASQQTRSTYRTDGPRAATFFQNVAFFPSLFNEKRSSPLISAGVLSSEGLCSSHLALLCQLTSALIATHRRDCCKSSAYASLALQLHNRLARPTAQMAHAQRHSYRTSHFSLRTLMKSGQAL